jgi:hypothetical protein
VVVCGNDQSQNITGRPFSVECLVVFTGNHSTFIQINFFILFPPGPLSNQISSFLFRLNLYPIKFLHSYFFQIPIQSNVSIFYLYPIKFFYSYFVWTPIQSNFVIHSTFIQSNFSGFILSRPTSS